MEELVFDGISKTYENGVEAVKDLTLAVPGPSLAVIVGPSGCGKTTVLRLLAGLEKPTAGAIYLGTERIDTLEPRKRDVAMVFQSYALFPHMSVRENLSFGLGLRKLPRAEIDARVHEVARRLDIERLLERKPAELSGGERQRVALGRAIVRRPRIYLFDEPLSSLDARLRMEMRYMLKKLYREMKRTTIYVTHDQVEAMTLGELLIVMEGGRVHQVGTPEECYRNPADTFVASFLGNPPMNLLELGVEEGTGNVRFPDGSSLPVPLAVARCLSAGGAGRVVLGMRPEDVVPASEAPHGWWRLRARFLLAETLGNETLVHLGIGGLEIVARTRPGALGEGDGVEVAVDPSRICLFSAGSGENVSLSVPGTP